eukprot:200676-Chlamydomonas_euryale.AAC.5
MQIWHAVNGCEGVHKRRRMSGRRAAQSPPCLHDAAHGEPGMNQHHAPCIHCASVHAFVVHHSSARLTFAYQT